MLSYDPIEVGHYATVDQAYSYQSLSVHLSQTSVSVCFLVPLQMFSRHVTLSALHTTIRALPRVASLVRQEVLFIQETFPALGTRKWPLSCVALLVPKKLPLPNVTFVALGAGERTLACVKFLVSEELPIPGETFPALGAGKRFVIGVGL